MHRHGVLRGFRPRAGTGRRSDHRALPADARGEPHEICRLAREARPLKMIATRRGDMSFTPHGKHLIAGEWVTGDATFASDPAHGRAHQFSVGTPELVARACEAAEACFEEYAATTRHERAAFLNAIADEI